MFTAQMIRKYKITYPDDLVDLEVLEGWIQRHPEEETQTAVSEGLTRQPHVTLMSAITFKLHQSIKLCFIITLTQMASCDDADADNSTDS